MKLVGVIVLVAAIVFFTGAAQADMMQVLINDFQFQPDTVMIQSGDTVTWINPGPVSHTVKFAGSESGVFMNGGSYSLTFYQPGTYDYICGIHPDMRGSVIVM